MGHAGTNRDAAIRQRKRAAAPPRMESQAQLTYRPAPDAREGARIGTLLERMLTMTGRKPVS